MNQRAPKELDVVALRVLRAGKLWTNIFPAPYLVFTW
jgi:hypothetical protein